MTMTLRKLLLAAGFLCSLAGAANANLVLVGGTPAASFTDLGAQGFGNAPRMLTLQDSPFESGSVTPVDVTNGGAIPGANKSTTPTLSALGWNNGSQVGIGFNSNQTGGSGITLDTLVLTIYSGTTSVGSFSLASPITFTAADLALQQGNGNAVFNFGLTPTEQAQFNAIRALAGSGAFFAGLSSSLGCATPSAGCLPSNDGADSFLGFVQVPGPVVGAGLPGLVMAGGMLLGLARRRRQKQA